MSRHEIDITYYRYNPIRQRLNLHLQSDVWKATLQSKDWANLAYLELKLCKIKASDVALISDLKWPQLIHLDLSRNQIGDEGISLVWEMQCPKLMFLKLQGYNKITGNGLTKMPDSSIIQHLKQLNLSTFNSIGCKGTKLISKSDLKNIEKLFLNQCQLNSQASKHLYKLNCPNLIHLQISSNKIGLDGAQNSINAQLQKVQSISVSLIEPFCCFWSYVIATNTPKNFRIHIQQQWNYKTKWVRNYINQVVEIRFQEKKVSESV